MANKRQVELVLAAQNNTNKAFDRVNKNITTLEKHTRRIKSMGNVFSGLIAGASVIASFRAVINATKEQEAALAQLDARLKSTDGAAGKTSKELQAMAAGLQKVTTFGDEAILSMQSMLLTFTNIKGDNFNEATKSILDMSVALKTDLKSASIQVGKALNDPIRGVTALSRSGVQFTETQRSMIKSLVETGETAKAQGIILDELKVQFGGAAEAAADTFGGALSQLSNAFGDLLEADGESLVSAKNEIKELTKLLQDPKTKEAMNNLTAAAVSFGGAMANIAVGFNDFGVFIGESLAKAVTYIEGSSESVAQLERQMAALGEQNKTAVVDIETTAETVARLGLEADATRDLLAELGGVQIAGDDFSKDTQSIIDKLEEERKVLKLNTKERFIYNQIKKAGTDATYEEINAIRKASEALFDEKEAIKAADKETKNLAKSTAEYKEKTDSIATSTGSASIFGGIAKEAEEAKEKTEEATKAKKELFSTTGGAAKDTSDAFNKKAINPIDLTPEQATVKAKEINAAMQSEFDNNPVQIRVKVPTPQQIKNDPVVMQSSINAGGFSSVTLSRQAAKEGTK